MVTVRVMLRLFKLRIYCYTLINNRGTIYLSLLCSQFSEDDINDNGSHEDIVVNVAKIDMD